MNLFLSTGAMPYTQCNGDWERWNSPTRALAQLRTSLSPATLTIIQPLPWDFAERTEEDKERRNRSRRGKRPRDLHPQIRATLTSDHLLHAPEQSHLPPHP